MSYVDFTKESPVILSLCSGGRGLERGVERAFKILQWTQPNYAAYVEINAFECFNLVAEMEAGMVASTPVWSNAKTFPAAEFYKRVHWVIGGYPCPGESVAGKMEYENYAGYLWPAVRKIVGATKPLGCFFENVENHLNGTFPKVYRDLRKMGYSVEAGIFSAEEIGAGHRRRRLFILAINVEYAKCEWKRGEAKTRFSLISTEASARLEKRRNAVGNAHCEGLQERNDGGIMQGENETSQRSEFSRAITKSFPARPGEEQYEWEEPRLIESGMGCTINGYNFREDLLRMYGNGVLEDTAELAFITLYNKLLNL